LPNCPIKTDQEYVLDPCHTIKTTTRLATTPDQEYVLDPSHTIKTTTRLQLLKTDFWIINPSIITIKSHQASSRTRKLSPRLVGHHLAGLTEFRLTKPVERVAITGTTMVLAGLHKDALVDEPPPAFIPRLAVKTPDHQRCQQTSTLPLVAAAAATRSPWGEPTIAATNSLSLALIPPTLGTCAQTCAPALPGSADDQRRAEPALPPVFADRSQHGTLVAYVNICPGAKSRGIGWRTGPYRPRNVPYVNLG